MPLMMVFGVIGIARVTVACIRLVGIEYACRVQRSSPRETCQCTPTLPALRLAALPAVLAPTPPSRRQQRRIASSRTSLTYCVVAGGFGDATVVVDGWTVARPDDLNPLYHEVNCPSPTKQEKKVTFRLTIQWVDADGAVNIPFKGKDKNDLVSFNLIT